MTTIDHSHRLLVSAGLAVALTFLAGCGGTGSVEGKVSSRSKGKNLVWGTVVMTGPDNIARSGMVHPDGSYAVQGLPTGEAVIRVSSDSPKALMQPRPAAGRGGRGTGPDEDRRPPDPNAAKDGGGGPVIADEVLKAWFPIPAKYADPAQSLLKVTIKPGKNQHDIVLD
ncbi:MAG: hypothetical protein U0797_25455 [Gemmataceae bacterium]